MKAKGHLVRENIKKKILSGILERRISVKHSIIILVVVYSTVLHAKYESSGLNGLREEGFQRFPSLYVHLYLGKISDPTKLVQA